MIPIRNLTFYTLFLLLLSAFFALPLKAAIPQFTNPAQITTHPADDFAPSISQDGKSLVYVSDRSGNLDLWVKYLVPGIPPPDQQLTFHSSEDNSPSISPDGNFIVFVSNRSDPKGDIYIIPLAKSVNGKESSTRPIKLTNEKTADGDPVWSPDQKFVYFTSEEISTGKKYIYGIEVSTRKRKKISKVEGIQPTLSPSGKYLAFVSQGKEKGLRVQNLKSHSLHKLTLGNYIDLSPKFSLDGKTIYFTRYEDDTNYDGVIDIEDHPNLWKTRLGHSSSKREFQLTDSSTFDLLPIAGNKYVYYTSHRKDGTDIWRLPLQGILPTQSDFGQQLQVVEVLCEDKYYYNCILADSNLSQVFPTEESLARVQYRRARGYQNLKHFKKAKTLYQNVFDSFPNSKKYQGWAEIDLILLDVADSRKKGQAFFKNKNKEALIKLQKIEERYSDQISVVSRAQLERGQIYISLQQFPEALSAFKHVVETYPSYRILSAEAAFSQSKVYSEVGDQKGLINSYVQVVRDYYDVESWSQKSIQTILGIFEEFPTLEKKMVSLQSLIKKYKELPRLASAAQNRIGELLHQANENLLAKEAYEKTIAQFPDTPKEKDKAHFALAQIYAEEENFEISLNQYQLVQSNSDSLKENIQEAKSKFIRQAIEKGNWELNVGETKLALKTFKKLMDFSPQTVEGHRGYIQSHVALKKTNEVIQFYKKKISVSDPLPVHWYSYGLALTYLDPPDLNKSKDSIEKALVKQSNNAFYHQTLGWIFEQKERAEGKRDFLEKSLQEYRTALALNDEEIDPQNEANLLLNLGNGNYLLKNYFSSYRYYDKRYHAKRDFVNADREALFYQRYAESAFKVGFPEQAVDLYKKSLKKISTKKDVSRMAELNDRIALAYQDLGDHSKAVEYFSQSLELNKEINNVTNFSRSLRNIANNLYSLSEKEGVSQQPLNNALGHYFQAIENLEKYGVKEKEKKKGKGLIDIDIETGLDEDASSAALGFDKVGEQKLIFNYIGKIYGDFGDYDRAIDYFERKLQLIPEDLDPKDNIPLLLEKALLLNQLGIFNFHQGQIAKSKDYFKRSYEVSHSIDNRQGLAVNAANIGRLLIDKCRKQPLSTLINEIKETTEFLEKTFQVLDDEKKPLSSPEYRVLLKNYIGVYYYYLGFQIPMDEKKPRDTKVNWKKIFKNSESSIQGDFSYGKKSLEAFQQAYILSLQIKNALGQKLAVALKQNTDVLRNLLGRVSASKNEIKAPSLRADFIKTEWQYKYLKASLQKGQKRLETLFEAEKLLSSRPYGVLLEPGGLGLLQDLYLEIVRSLFKEKRLGNALHYSEKGLRLSLISEFQEISFEFKDEIRRSYFEEIQGFGLDWNGLLQSLRKEEINSDEFREKSQDLYDEYKEFLLSVEEEDLDLVSFVSPKVPTLSKVQSVLGEGQTLIKYQMIREELFVWIISQTSFFGVRLSPKDYFYPIVLRFSEKGQAIRKNELNILSQHLVYPLRKYIKNAKSLIILPFGSLDYLPWSLLKFNGKPLIEEFDLVFANSLDQLVRASDKKNLYNSRFMGFEINENIFNQIRPEFASSKNYIKEKGTVDEFFKGLSQYGVINIDSQTLIDQSNQNNSYISLTNRLNHYERFFLKDLFENKIESHLIALNDTHLKSSSSFISPTTSLIHGLVFVGFPGSLLKIGHVDPKIHDEFLKVFYADLRKSSPSKALRKAQLYLREKFPQSDGWANYRYYGFPGMSKVEKEEFAQTHFESNVSQGAEEFKNQNWEGAISYFEKALALVNYLEDQSSEDQLIKTIVQAAYNRGDYSKGIEYQKKVLTNSQDGEDPEQLAEAHYFLGILYSRAEQYSSSVNHLKQALSIYQEYEILDKLAESYGTLGVVEENALDFDNALKALNASVKINEEIGEDLNRGKELRRIGRVNYLRLNKYAEAQKYFSEANSLFQELNDPEQIAETWLELGLVSEKLGDFSKALGFYKKAELLAEDNNLILQISKSYLYQGNTHWFQGNYQKAFRFQKQALKLAEEIGDKRQQAFVYNTLGLIYWTLNDSPRALNNMEKSQTLAGEINSLIDVASAFNNMGLVYRKDKKYEKSIEFFEEALKRDLQLKSKWGQGYTHRNLGISYLRMKLLVEAEEHFSKAIRLSEEIGNQINLVKTKLELGNLYLEKNQCEQAVPIFKATVKLSKAINVPEVTWRALQGQGKCFVKTNRKKEAVPIYKESVAIVDKMRASIKVEEFQNGFITDKQDLYKELIILLLDKGEVEESFNYAERAKSRSFIDLLGNQKINLKDSVSQELFNRLNEQKLIIHQIENLLGQTEEEEEIQKVSKKLIQARNRYQDLLIEAKETSPEISSFVTVDSITLEKLKTIIEKDMVLVEYLITDKELIAWVINDKDIQVVRTKLEKSKLENLIMDYRTRIQKLAPLDDQSIQLYDWIIRPVEKLISNYRVVGIIPQGYLHYLSFASLSDRKAYLFERHPIFYSPSASVLDFTFKRKYKKEGPVKVLALGNPDLGTFNYDLPLAELEAKAIRWDFPEVTILTREDATESWLQENIHKYQVIHIASHGEFDPVNPLFSALKLAKDKESDGNFEVNEVFSLNINADLVTLSACQTGLGDIVGGDELVGLNRAFIYAGTHAIISSLWRVSDISTAVLIKHFYRNYTESNKAESLRKAQLLVKSLYPHPGYWAAFSLTGDYR